MDASTHPRHSARTSARANGAPSGHQGVGHQGVTVRDLIVRRGGTAVLRKVSCRMAAQQVTGLFGPSGSGKTTLMRAIVGSQITHGGEVTVLGQPAGAAALRTSVAYTTQAPSVYGDVTVAQNLTYFAALSGAPRRAIDPVLAEVGLTAYASQLTRTLSGGQLHRVSLACALVGEPRLLVLDEPTVGLDPLLREEIWASLRARAGRGTTILVSSHVMEEAGKCDDLILLREGEVLFAGTPEELQTRTATADLDEAFLRLVRAPEQADPA